MNKLFFPFVSVSHFIDISSHHAVMLQKNIFTKLKLLSPLKRDKEEKSTGIFWVELFGKRTFGKVWFVHVLVRDVVTVHTAGIFQSHKFSRQIFQVHQEKLEKKPSSIFCVMEFILRFMSSLKNFKKYFVYATRNALKNVCTNKRNNFLLHFLLLLPCWKHFKTLQKNVCILLSTAIFKIAHFTLMIVKLFVSQKKSHIWKLLCQRSKFLWYQSELICLWKTRN